MSKPFRLALIGCQNHWQTYAAMLKEMPEARVVAVAPACPSDKLASFEKAPGVTPETLRFDDAAKLLDEAAPDLVNISSELDAVERWNLEAARRGISFACEKPMAMGLEQLETLWQACEKSGARAYPLQGILGTPSFHAAQEVVRAGRIGTPLSGYHQKSYRWGTRPEYYKDRAKFPGIVPWVGIHALAWMQWILGDLFTEVAGWQTTQPRPEYEACAASAGVVLHQANGGVTLLSCDFLRPQAAPTHGDERLRIAGSEGLVEALARTGDTFCTLITRDEGPQQVRPQGEIADDYAQFARSLRGEAPAPVAHGEGFRVTEIAFLAQRAVESGRPVPLLPSRFAPATSS